MTGDWSLGRITTAEGTTGMRFKTPHNPDNDLPLKKFQKGNKHMTTNQTLINQTTSFTCDSCGINVEDRLEHISLSEAIERLGGWNKPGCALCEDCWPEMSARQA